ncbi:hypothetical protein V2J09_014657 [Rumex salicifolius]
MWATTENQGNFLGRISIRRNQVASAEGDVDDLEFFQRKIAERFSDLVPSSSSTSSSTHQKDQQSQSSHPPHPPSLADLSNEASSTPEGAADAALSSAASAAVSDPLMSIAWLRKLLDAFLCCEAEFKATLLMGRDPSHIVKSPLDRLIPELLDRTVKALDVCNAITHGVEAIRYVQMHAEIAVSTLEERPFTDGQVRRAKKALASVMSSIVIDEKESSASKSTERSWSFGRRGAATKDRHISNFRSLSWSVSKNWSAAKQIQAISSNLYPPRGAESTGLAMTVYIMSVVLAFVTWTLVAAIPCQERAGLGAHIPIPKQLGWTHGMSALQEKIADEWKKKEKKGGAGLMDEVAKIDKASQSLLDSLSHFQFPMEEQKEVQVADQVAELAEACKRMEEGLNPFQKQIREVFHRIVRSRVEVLDMLDQAAKLSAPNMKVEEGSSVSLDYKFLVVMCIRVLEKSNLDT